MVRQWYTEDDEKKYSIGKEEASFVAVFPYREKKEEGRRMVKWNKPR